LIDRARVHTSYLNRLPAVNRYFRYLAPLYPRAFESFDLNGFDTIVSSTTAWAKGVRVPAGAVHVCYLNTVSRFTFDRHYAGGFRFGGLARPVLERLIAWDHRAAARPTRLIANSRNVADRIKQYYGRDATVLHCPVDLDRFTVGSGDGDYFAIASRLLPYKRIELAIEAADAARVKLYIAGTGPSERKLRRLARGTTTTMLGYVSDPQLNALFGAARAIIVPGEEDFGLAPLEAAAAGRPAIALRAGGALETVAEGQTGVFFDEPAPQALANVLRAFEAARYDPQRLRAHACAFSPETFIVRLQSIVEETRAAA